MKTIGAFLAGVVMVFCMAASGVAGDIIKVGLVDTYTGPATTSSSPTSA